MGASGTPAEGLRLIEADRAAAAATLRGAAIWHPVIAEDLCIVADYLDGTQRHATATPGPESWQLWYAAAVLTQEGPDEGDRRTIEWLVIVGQHRFAHEHATTKATVRP